MSNTRRDDSTASERTRASDPTELSPATAVEMWIDDESVRWSSATERDYLKNMRRWLLWCDSESVEEVGELSGWDVRLFKRARADDENRDGEKIAPTTLRSSMMTLKQLIDWLVSVDAVEPALSDKAADAIPVLSDEDATDDTMWPIEEARQAITFYRDSVAHRATANHALIEVFIHVGCRRGGLRALDLRDYDSGTRTLRFVNRPDTDTRLKRGNDGERAVAVSPQVSEVLDEYIARERVEKTDDYGREPLFCFRQGRPSVSTIQSRVYLATQPCVYSTCPHDEHPDECKFRARNHASKCKSSFSPHPLRTTSITWHRDQRVPMEKTAERVNATADTIEKYYDKADKFDRVDRRRPTTGRLDITNEDSKGDSE